MFYGNIHSLVSLCLLLLSGLVQVQVNVRHSSPSSTSSLWSPSRSSNFAHPSTEEIETRPFGEESYHLFLNNVTREMILKGKHGDGECQVVDSSTSTSTSSNTTSVKKDGNGKAPIVINIWSTTPDGKLVLNQRKEITKRILPLNQPPPQEESSAENELDAQFSTQAGNATNRDVLLYLLEELVTTQKRLEDNRESEYLLNGFSSLELFPSTSSRPRPVLGMSPRQILEVELSNSTTSGEDSWTTVLDIMKLNTVQNISRTSDESYDDENLSSPMGYIPGQEEQVLESLKIGNLTVGSRRLDRRLVQNLLNLTAGPEFSSTLALKPICVPTLKDEGNPSAIDGGIPIPTSENANQLPGLPVFPGPGSDIGVALQDWWGYNDYEFKKVKQSKKKKDKGHQEEHHGWGHEEDHGWGHEEEHHKKKKHKHKDKHKKEKHKKDKHKGHKKKKHKHHESHHHHSKEEHHHHHHPAPQHGWGWQPPPQQHHGWGWAPPPPPPPPVHHGWGWPQQHHHQEHHGWGHEEHHKEEEHHDKKHDKKHHKEEKKKQKKHKKQEKWKKKQHKKKEKHKKKAHKKHHESEEKCHHGWGWDHKEGHHKGDHGWGWGHKEQEHGHGWGHKPEPPKQEQHGWGWGSYKEPPKKEHGWVWSWGPMKEESSKKPKQQTKKVAIRMPAPFEIGGWLGGSGHEEDDGYHEMELIPSDMFHNALTGMGIVALLLGPFVFIAGLCWLVSSMSRPAYVIHGGGRGWRRRMGLSAGARDVDGGWGWGKYGDGDE